MATKTNLIVDDEPDIVTIARDYLDRAGFRVITAGDGASALRLARSEHPSLLVLDLMLPGVDGLDVARALRQEPATRRLPIIMLTARVEETDRLIGLEIGADDYITKPFSPRELVARVKAILRRSRHGHAAQSEPSGALSFPGLTIDPVRREVQRNGAAVALTAREFDLLHTLAATPGRVFTREQLLERVWGHDFDGVDRVVDVHVSLLRRKLEADPADPAVIVTVRGVGYKFVA
jgi:two-component system alkaline phosphatase synthesis response regulator PhoP